MEKTQNLNFSFVELENDFLKVSEKFPELMNKNLNKPVIVFKHANTETLATGYCEK